MKINKCVDVYHCDCCGQEIGTQSPYKMLSGYNSINGEVSFEPKVMGDYCEECIIIAQINWDDENIKGFVSDRYDPFNEKVWRDEVTMMQFYYESYNDNDPDWYYQYLQRNKHR